MVLGYFGKTPLPPDPQIINLAREQLGLKQTAEKPIDINDNDPAKGVKPAEEMLKKNDLPVTQENIFIAATCKEKGIQFLKGEGRVRVRKKEEIKPSSEEKAKSLIVTVNGKNYNVSVSDDRTVVEGIPYRISVKESTESQPENTRTENIEEVIEAPVPGLILKIHVETGETFKPDQELLVLEAMKMETPVSVPYPGLIQELMVKTGDQVQAGEPLVKVKKH
jgi:pyruvate carboxylase subunit B